MEAVEKGTHSLRKASRSWNIPPNSLFDHLNEKTSNGKMGLASVLTQEEDVMVVAWILKMQECAFSITLQQFKMKVENSPK